MCITNQISSASTALFVKSYIRKCRMLMVWTKMVKKSYILYLNLHVIFATVSLVVLAFNSSHRCANNCSYYRAILLSNLSGVPQLNVSAIIHSCNTVKMPLFKSYYYKMSLLKRTFEELREWTPSKIKPKLYYISYNV